MVGCLQPNGRTVKVSRPLYFLRKASKKTNIPLLFSVGRSGMGYALNHADEVARNRGALENKLRPEVFLSAPFAL
jgi:hypothetical protein